MRVGARVLVSVVAIAVGGIVGAAPVPAGAAAGVATSITAGEFHSCALMKSGIVKCWGLNNRNQIGNLTAPPNVKKPVAVNGLTGAIAVTAGDSHTCALLKAGTVKCWGANDVGELGSGPFVDSKKPLLVAGLTGVTAIAAGGDHTCALLKEQTVKCWGRNYPGVLGNGTTVSSASPVDVIGLSGVTSISTGNQDSCALLDSGTVKCWGYNGDAELSTGRSKGPETCAAGEFDVACSTKPVTANGLKGVVAVTNGTNSTCAVLRSGTVKCWGDNGHGSLGNGTTLNSTKPVSVTGLKTVVSVVSNGRYGPFTCALLTAGNVKCWGVNGDGTLGTGTTAYALKPVNVVALAGATAIAAGGDHACARLAAGTVKCWGLNVYGELGNGSETTSTKPVFVIGL